MPSIDFDEERYQIEDDARTLESAVELLSDAERLDKAKAHIKKRQQKLKRIAKMKGMKGGDALHEAF